MSSSFSLYIVVSLLSLISFFLHVVAVAASNHSISQNSNNFVVSKKRAQSLYEKLRLSPALDANILKRDPLVDMTEIVESRFRFPSLSDHDNETAAGPNVREFGHYAGYYRLNNTHGAWMFYYFFESRKNDTNAPVIVWLTGGPGCSSSIALFYENGPFHLTNDLSLVWNEYGWDMTSQQEQASVIQPDEDDIRHTSKEGAIDLYNFIQAFLEKHPMYVKNEFYITGESYAGHYIPAFAAQIQKGNKNVKQTRNVHINLKGIAIGNGLTNSGIQFKAYPDYALKMKLINQTLYDQLQGPARACQQKVHKSCDGSNYNWTDCAEAKDDCGVIFSDIMKSNKGINYYDIRKRCAGSTCYNFSSVERFLNERSVKQALGVKENITFLPCSRKAYKAMYGDWMKNYAVHIPKLLADEIKVMIYAGEYDLICNWLGNLMWVGDMKWCGQKNFSGACNATFRVDGAEVGWYKTYGPLTFLMVKDAGHMVPMDQPKPALEMLSRWTKGILL